MSFRQINLNILEMFFWKIHDIVGWKEQTYNLSYSVNPNEMSHAAFMIKWCMYSHLVDRSYILSFTIEN